MTRTQWITAGVMGLLAVLPPVFYLTGNAFYLDLATRLVILAIAAVSLNLILGYGGLVSFGHAAYVGLGRLCRRHPRASLALRRDGGAGHHQRAGADPARRRRLGALRAADRAICLRTKGVYFIMITMAFAQMVYYLFISIEHLRRR
jgi:branched-chain amino acid transport system permease protein